MSSDKYILQEVVDARTEREFLDLPRKSIRGIVTGYVPSILRSRLFSIRRKTRCSPMAKPFAGSHAIKRRSGGTYRRFYDREHAFLEEQPTGGCGFFEAINDQELADQLSMQPACGFPAGVWRRWTVRSISVPGIPGGGCWSAGTNFSPSMRTRTIRLIIKSCSKITDSRTTSTSIPICVGWRWGS